jgi:hypothetical protein
MCYNIQFQQRRPLTPAPASPALNTFFFRRRRLIAEVPVFECYTFLSCESETINCLASAKVDEWGFYYLRMPDQHVKQHSSSVETTPFDRK